MLLPKHNCGRLSNLFLLVFTLLAVCPVQVACAQDGKIIGGLLRELIESEMRRREQELRERGNVPQLAQPPRNSQFTNNLRQAQGFYASLHNESRNLFNMTQAALGRTPGLRNSLDELQTLVELSNTVAQNFRQPLPEAVVIDSVRSVDSHWRLSKYRLEQVTGLPANIRNSMKEIDRLNGRCCDLFDVEPQINQHEVVRLVDSLAAELHHLERDVEFAARFTPRAKESVMRLRRLETRVRLLSDSVAANEGYEVVVAEYQAVASEWRSVSLELDKLNDRYVDRTVEEIRAIDAALREQLWLPTQLDREHFQHIADAAGKNIQVLMQSITLDFLLALPNAEQTLRAAAALDREARALCECAAQNSPQEDLIEHWQELNSAWQAMVPTLGPKGEPGVQTLVAAIDSQLEAMRQTLGVQLIFDPQQVVKYAAQLEGISEQIVFHAVQWQRQRGSNATGYAIGLANEFRNDARRLHNSCAAGKPQQQLFDQCNQVTRKWAKLQPELSRCNSRDRSALLRLSESTTKCLAHLQALLQ